METALSAAAVADFLRVVADICHSVIALHDGSPSEDQPAIDGDVARKLFGDLVRVVAPIDKAAGDPSNDGFAWACSKVGGDLFVHLDRLISLPAASSPEVENKGHVVAAFRQAWPEVDVQALASRLHDLISQWKDRFPSFA